MSIGIDPSELYQSFEDQLAARRKELEEEYKMDELVVKGEEGWEMPGSSWSSHYHPSVCVANYRAWPRHYPRWIIQASTNDGHHYCLLRASALASATDAEWKKIIKDIASQMHDYPLVDDGIWSEVESEYQEKAWDETYRKEFQKAMQAKFEDVFTSMAHGDTMQMKFDEMISNDKATDDFFHALMQHSSTGSEWDESSSGDQCLNVAEIVKGIDTSDVINHIWPEDPRQMKFAFTHQEAVDLVTTLLHDDYMFLLEAPLANKIVDTLLETGGVHSHSCLMINLPEELGRQIMDWGKLNVREEDIYVDEDGKGREDEPHITVLYGLFDEKPSDALLQVFEHTGPFDVELGPCSLFRNGKYDVLKMEVVSPFLHALNQNVCSVVAYENSYPDYKPHITIAYVKPGTCDRLEGKSPWDDEVKMGQTALVDDGVFTAKTVIFSSTNGTKEEYSLGSAKSAAKTVESFQWDDDQSWQWNLFTADKGKLPFSSGELAHWLQEMIKDYNEKSGRRYDQHLMASRDDLRAWIEGKLAVRDAVGESANWDALFTEQSWQYRMFTAYNGKPPSNSGELAQWMQDMIRTFNSGKPFARQFHKSLVICQNELRSWLEAGYAVRGAMGESDEDDMEKFVVDSGAADIPVKHTSNTIRRAISRRIVDKVEIWRGNDDSTRPGYPRNPPPEGNIKIVYRENGRADSPRKIWTQGWASFEVLKYSLRHWRNLYGVPLIKNGQEAGTVSYSNPALAE